MKKSIQLLIITVICVGLSTLLPAQEKSGMSLLVAVSRDARPKLKNVQLIAIFLNGNDTLLTRIVEDALAIHLTNAGVPVINREKLEKSVGEQITKIRREDESGAVNALAIGKAVNADFILTGTTIVDFAQDKPLLVKVASFQLVDVAGEKTVIAFLSEPEKGKSFSEISREFVDMLQQNRK